MKKRWIGTCVTVAVLIGTGLLGVTFAEADIRGIQSGTIRVGNHMESELPDLAEINALQAVKTALKKVEGNILKVELENENGFLVYGVEVVTEDKSIVDVKVDAGSGTILTVDRDHKDNEKGDRDQDRDDRDREDKD